MSDSFKYLINWDSIPKLDLSFYEQDEMRMMQGYIQADIDMTNLLYSGYTPPFKPLVVTTTTVVTAPFSHSTSLEESIETWLTDKGYFVEMYGAIRIVSGSHRSRLLSHLRMLGIRIYSIKTEVEVL